MLRATSTMFLERFLAVRAISYLYIDGSLNPWPSRWDSHQALHLSAGPIKLIIPHAYIQLFHHQSYGHTFPVPNEPSKPEVHQIPSHPAMICSIELPHLFSLYCCLCCDIIATHFAFTVLGGSAVEKPLFPAYQRKGSYNSHFFGHGILQNTMLHYVYHRVTESSSSFTSFWIKFHWRHIFQPSHHVGMTPYPVVNSWRLYPSIWQITQTF